MASTVISLSLLSTLSAAANTRPKSRRDPRKPVSFPRNPNPKSNAKPKSKPNPKTLIGTEATTFTRLPRRDAAFSSPSSTIIKLRDSLPSTPVPPKAPSFDEFEALGLDSDEEEDDNEALGVELEGEGDEMILGLGSDSEEDEEGEGMIEEEGEVLEDLDVKEKGVPAIMRCFDRAKIYVKAGNGGNGVVAFRREKYVPYGGPSGGDGGRGGCVYVEVDGSMNSLLPFRKNVHFRAGRGDHGQGKKQAGAKGEDVVVKVAPGTVIRDAGTGEALLELMNVGERALVLPGGRGGRGNASFKSGTNKVPKIAENGEEGAEMYGFFFLLFSNAILLLLSLSLLVIGFVEVN